MNKRKFFILIMGLALAVAAFPWGRDLAEAGPGTAATAAAATPSGGTFYANSPILTKFVDSLPGLGAANANNLGQYIPIAVPDTTTFPGSDYYEIALVEYREQMHSELPAVVGSKTTGTGGTRLRGYVQEIGGVSLTEPHYMGPLIIATKDRPVRIKFRNALPTGTAGNLFLPVDPTVTGAGMGPKTAAGADCDPSAVGAACAEYTQNRALLRLHGGFNPWISDGTPHQWITPAGETTPYLRGVSQQNVPDMWFDATTHALIPGASLTAPNANATNDPGPECATYYYTNAQTARLLFYHDNSYGITRLNVYAGEFAGYLINDPVEQGLVNSGIVPSTQIPLVIQDKTFVPQDIAVQDAKWDTTKWGQYGDLWFPHVYETNQWPDNPNLSQANDFGRWDYGPWFWPIFPVAASKADIFTSATSVVPESMMDTPVINGTAYPYLNVDRKAYRFRIVNASNDRTLNLGIYYADPDVGQGTEVKMIAADPRSANELAAYFGQGTAVYNGSWSTLDSRSLTGMAYSSGISTLYVNGTNGAWQYDGTTWIQISTSQATRIAASDTHLFLDYGVWGLWQWDGSTITQIDANQPQDFVASSTDLYANYSGWGLYKFDGISWTLISPSTASSMVPSGSNLYANFTGWGLAKYDGSTWTQIDTNSPQDMVASSSALYANYANWGLFKYDGAAWSLISPNTASKMVGSSSSADLYASFTGSGAWHYDGTTWTSIDANMPANMVASSSGLFADYAALGLWKYSSSTGFAKISTTAPSLMVPVSFLTGTNWPTDGRTGGVPDPVTAGPNMIQIGNDGGLLPQAVVIPNQPTNYIYFRRIIVVGNISTHALLLSPGERADVIVDFSQVPAGSKLIMYNDAPAPNPVQDVRYDYYTGDPDQTSTGGAPSTKPGFGPNTRTIMQFRVSNAAAATAFDLQALRAAIPGAYVNSQKQPIVAQSAYNAAFGTDFSNNYAGIFTGSASVPTFDFIAGAAFNYKPLGSTTLTATDFGQFVQLPVYDKAIVEEMDTYGRLYFQLGTEIQFTTIFVQTTLPFNFLDPASETLLPGEVQIWKITHNGILTHPLHINSMEMQVINRVAWDGTIMPPDPGELGWKDAVIVNALETTFIAVRASTPPTPATMGTLPRSNRLLDPTMPANTTAQFMNIDPLTGNPASPTVTNILTDFGHEYAWSTMQWGHQDNDMKRPVILDVQ